MKRSISISVCIVLFACLGRSVLAQSTVVPAHKYCWGENVGFFNWRDAGNPAGAQGVRIGPRFLSGYAWGENIGWINLGDGSPADGVAYANPIAGTVVGVPDFGVNRAIITGTLSGYAWGENVGWINFSGGAMATPANPARYDPAARRLRGYAWGENIGWINLDHVSIYVGDCPADFNNSGTISVQDIFDFLAAYFANDPRADFNGSGVISVQDIFDFLAAYFAGCP